ncbi:hypothetical protein HYV44_00725 [Candidatus Microgenomates bacterium]|nr:hypothetical protein [Candidatus Microgenomates bacterium]
MGEPNEIVNNLVDPECKSCQGTGKCPDDDCDGGFIPGDIDAECDLPLEMQHMSTPDPCRICFGTGKCLCVLLKESPERWGSVIFGEEQWEKMEKEKTTP